jgi:hypothetical protein
MPRHDWARVRGQGALNSSLVFLNRNLMDAHGPPAHFPVERGENE